MDSSKRFTWGSGIFLLYTGFVVMIGFMVYKSTNEKVDLVAPDYYKQELQFQDRLDRIARTNALEVKPVWVKDSEKITFTFPADMQDVSGEIYFFKPSDKKLDLRVPITLSSGEQSILLANLSQGSYRIQLTWSAGGKEYFKEGHIYID